MLLGASCTKHVTLSIVNTKGLKLRCPMIWVRLIIQRHLQPTLTSLATSRSSQRLTSLADGLHDNTTVIA